MNNQFFTTQTVYDPISLKERVMFLYRKLAALDSLRPSPETNELFFELVSLVLHNREHGYLSFFSQDDIRAIRGLAMEGEFLLEKHWNEKVLASEDAWATLRSFPYYGNYVEMAALERPFIRGSEVMFVGSGPLPLSAIVLAHEYDGIRCIGVERDREAYEMSTRLIKRLGLDARIQIIHADIATIDPVPGSSIILGAAVGETTREKCAFLELLSSRVSSGTPIIARSAEDIVQVLYAAVPDEPIKNLTLVTKRLPPSSIVNSLAVYSA